MRHAAIALFPVLALSLALGACATPQQACIADATRELGRVTRLASEAQENIARGYAVEFRQEVRLEPDTCRGETDEGIGFSYDCIRPRTVNVPHRVPVNVPSEQARLQSLLEQQAALERQSRPVVQACIAAYPQ